VDLSDQFNTLGRFSECVAAAASLAKSARTSIWFHKPDGRNAMRKRLVAALITITISSTASSEALPLAAASLKGAAAQLQLTERAYYYGYRPYYGYYRPYYRPYYGYYRPYYRPYYGYSYYRPYYPSYGYYRPYPAYTYGYRPVPWWVSGPY
jgi:hypothetical protein